MHSTLPGMAAARRLAAPVVIIAVAACSSARPAPPPAPAPGPAVAAPVAALPPMAPARAAGTYVLQATIQGRTIPVPAPTPAPPPRGRAAAAPAPARAPAASLQLTARPPAALDPTAPSITQLAATVALPGYTVSPRGRLAQAASWWPVGGDSLVVFFTQPQRAAAISLRGVLRGDSLSGDVWYTSTSSGAEFQLGTFTAVRRRPR
jgi:hypothetical protein